MYTQPFPIVVDGTTIESAVYNGFTTDVTTDLNTPRPVIAGGTGASSADQALFNLAAEKAAQVVTNYDSHVFLPGSFRSAAGATGAPNAHAFAGTVTIGEALANPPTNQNVVVEARDLGDTVSPGRKYVREKKAGVWGSWGEGVYAAPLDALAYNGMQINGSMDVSQEKGASGTGVSGTHICDGWKLIYNGTMVISGYAVPFTVPGFSSLIYSIPSTAQTSLGVNDYAMINQRIEGYRTSRLAWGTANAQPITIGFWSQHSKTGLYSVAVRNAAGNRAYVASYTQVGATAQYNTVTIPGCTDGTWGVDNTVGIDLYFTYAAGTNSIVSTANSWVVSGATAVSGQVNCVSTTTDVFRITGVVVLPGIEAPSAARSPFVMRPYDQELLTCQRYYEKLSGGGIGSGQAYSTTGALISLRWQRKRTLPTVGHINLGNLALTTAVGGFVATSAFAGASYTNEIGGTGNYTVASGLVAGNGTTLSSSSTNNDFVTIDARL